MGVMSLVTDRTQVIGPPMCLLEVHSLIEEVLLLKVHHKHYLLDVSI